MVGSSTRTVSPPTRWWAAGTGRVARQQLPDHQEKAESDKRRGPRWPGAPPQVGGAMKARFRRDRSSPVSSWNRAVSSTPSGRGRGKFMSTGAVSFPLAHDGDRSERTTASVTECVTKTTVGLSACQRLEEEVGHVLPGHLVEGAKGLVHQEQRGARRRKRGRWPPVGASLPTGAPAAWTWPGAGRGVQGFLPGSRSSQRARLLTSRGSLTFSRTVRQGNRAGDWGTQPRCLARLASTGASPKTET